MSIKIIAPIEPAGNFESVYAEHVKMPDDSRLSEWATKVATKVDRVIVPEMHGAKGDGETDDTDALRKAAAACKSTKSTFATLPGKTYRIKGAVLTYSI